MIPLKNGKIALAEPTSTEEEERETNTPLD